MSKPDHRLKQNRFKSDKLSNTSEFVTSNVKKKLLNTHRFNGIVQLCFILYLLISLS